MFGWKWIKYEKDQDWNKSALYLRLKKRKVFKIIKGGTFRLFENLVCCKISKKIEGGTVRLFFDIFLSPKGPPSSFLIFCSKLWGHLENLEFFEKKIRKKTKNENFESLIVPKNLKRETLWAFWNFSLLHNIKKLEGGPFGDKKTRKVVQCRLKFKGETL